MAQVIELYSTMNSGHEVYIAPNDPDHYNEIEKVATAEPSRNKNFKKLLTNLKK